LCPGAVPNARQINEPIPNIATALCRAVNKRDASGEEFGVASATGANRSANLTAMKMEKVSPYFVSQTQY
jgi:hypothetical protein